MPLSQLFLNLNNATKLYKIAFIPLLIISFNVFSSQLSLRCALYSPIPKDRAVPVPTGYLKRVYDAGYNYVIFRTKKKASIEDYKKQFIQIDVQFNGKLKGIPVLSTATKWIGSLGITNPNHLNSYKTEKNRFFETPSFAYDPELTKTIRDELRKIEIAYNSSGARKINNSDLEYIFMGHDEPCENNQLLVANGNKNQSILDRDFIEQAIQRKKVSAEIAYRMLFVKEIELRIEDVESIPNFKNTRIIIFADMWDPEANGGCRFKVSYFPHSSKPLFDSKATTICLAPNDENDTNEIIDLPGCVNPDNIKKKIVLAPWCYSLNWKFNGSNPHPPYKPRNTFTYFASSGFDFIYTSTLNTSADSPITREKKEAVYAYASASRKLPDNQKQHFFGYIAASWTNHLKTPSGAWVNSKDMYKQTKNFEIIEFLPIIYINLKD